MSEANARRATVTGGRTATTGVIPGRYALSVGDPGTAAPDGWAWTRLDAVARLESGHTPSRKQPSYWDGDIPWIGIKDATANHGSVLKDTFQHITEDGLRNSSARLLPSGTVCLSRTASVGYVVTMGAAMATSQDFVNWVCGPNLDHRFLHYVLLAEHDSMLRFASGTVHQTIYFPEAKAMHICMPPLAEQHDVVRVLGSFDKKIEINRELIRDAESVLSDGFLRRFRDRDDSAMFGDYSRSTQTTTDPTRLPPETPYVGLEHMPRGSLTLQEWETVQKVNSTKVQVRTNDVLFGKLRPNFHKVAVAPVDGVASSDILVIRPVRPDYWGISVAIAGSKAMNAHAVACSSGTKMPRVNWSDLARFPVPAVTHAEAQDFNRLAVPLLLRCRSAAQENLSLAQARDILMPRLLRGRPVGELAALRASA